MACEGCPFGGECIRSTGNADAPLVIVGEAPGAQEIHSGTPFVGPSGKLLWETLQRFGIHRAEEVLVTNALRCRPPSGTPIPRGAIDACRGRLLHEISHGPKVVISLGNTALRSITGNHALKITQERGKVLHFGETPVVPVLHPAAILRNSGDYKKFRDDLEYAISLYNGEPPRGAGETRYNVARPETVDKWIKALRKYPLLAADIETSGLDPLQDRILCLGVAWEPNKVVIFEEDTLGHLSDLFAPGGPEWVWHNGKFDTKFLQQRGYPAGVDHDTMLAHYALDEQTGGHDLKTLATDYLGADDYSKVLKPWLPNKSVSFEVIPQGVLNTYLAKDADYTLQLYHVLISDVRKDAKLLRLYQHLLLPASRFLQRVEQNGFWVHTEELDRLGAQLAVDVEEAKREMLFHAVWEGWDSELYMKQTGSKTKSKELNVGSPKQLSWFLYDRLGLGPSGTNTAEKTLAELPEHPFVAALLRYRKLAKVLSTYVVGVRQNIRSDGRVHSTYLIHGSVTGRLSSRGPNLQNIPRDKKIRRIFAAPPGRKIVELDYSSHELRCLAQLSGDPDLIQIFMDGRDLHDEVSLTMYGPDFTQDQRVRAKAVNFGIAYGRSGYSLAAEFSLSRDEGEQLVRDWFSRFPRAEKFINLCRSVPAQGSVLVTPFGRKRRFTLVDRQQLHQLQNEASNFPIQSLASDLTLAAAMAMEEHLQERGAIIVNLVHDSIVIEAPEETAYQIAEEAKAIMEETPSRHLTARVPFKADYKIGQAWGMKD